MPHRAPSVGLLLLLLLAGHLLADIKQADLVGTWKWTEADGKAVPYPFYMRLSPDGKAATWPAPKDWSNTTNYVSNGAWKLDKGRFIIVHSESEDNRSSRVEIKGDTFTAITDDDTRLVYKRVVPDLKPGSLDGRTALEAAKLKATDLVGTWESIRVNGEPVEQPTFMKFLSDGKAAAWQAQPHSIKPINGVTDATWRLEDGYLLYDSKSAGQNFRAWITLNKKELTIVTEDQTESTFQRTEADLSPEK